MAIDPLQKLLEVAIEKGYLSMLQGRAVNMRTSMYADETAIFIKPTRNDVAALADLLNKFGDATGLKANFQKSTVVPIFCDNVALHDVLVDLPAKKSHFPIKYPGLPLTTRRLRRVDFQPPIDKAVSKLTLWNGRNINPAGQLTSKISFHFTSSIFSNFPQAYAQRD
jgi:hypothetical protein